MKRLTRIGTRKGVGIVLARAMMRSMIVSTAVQDSVRFQESVRSWLDWAERCWFQDEMLEHLQPQGLQTS